MSDSVITGRDHLNPVNPGIFRRSGLYTRLRDIFVVSYFEFSSACNHYFTWKYLSFYTDLLTRFDVWSRKKITTNLKEFSRNYLLGETSSIPLILNQSTFALRGLFSIMAAILTLSPSLQHIGVFSTRILTLPSSQSEIFSSSETCDAPEICRGMEEYAGICKSMQEYARIWRNN